MNTTCTTLIQRVRDLGDSAAWDEFHRVYSKLVYRYARDRGLNDTDALDLVADCMATLAREMPTFCYDQQKGRFRGWLKTVVSNRITDFLRKKRPLQADTELLAGLHAAGQSPDQNWDQHWRLSHLWYCWQQIEQGLPADHAEVFRLCVFEERKAAEVAEQLGLQIGNVYMVKSRLTRRLRHMLRSLLGDEF